ncbi:hypothetical protein CI593_00185 [Fischerella thermalis CCMEE 5194]|nr:hypothetical protein CI593_00185 [Fischerella thermalis CCMEE 5194]
MQFKALIPKRYANAVAHGGNPLRKSGWLTINNQYFHFRYNGCQIYAFRYKIWSSDIILLTLFLGKIYKKIANSLL